MVQFHASLGLQRQGALAAIPSAEALVALLKKNGIDDAALALPLNGFIGPQQIVTVVGSLRKPTMEHLRSLVLAVGRDVSADAAQVQLLQFGLALDDCTAVEAAVQQAAIDDARAHAEKLAAAAKVHLGGVLSISEPQGLNTSACPTKPDRLMQTGGNSGQYDTSANPLDVVISTSVTVTFAIE